MRLPLIFSVLLLPLLLTAQAQSQLKQTGQFFAEECGTLEATDHPGVIPANKIFERVLAVADKSGKRIPRLVMVKEKSFSCEGNLAQALPDGSVLIMEPLLTLAYKEVPPHVGDARMAFVLGHELSHLARDDYWHTEAFYALRTYGSQKDAEHQILQHLLQCCSNVASYSPEAVIQARKVAQTKELQADAYGILYMTMAGYDPRVILDHNGVSFFEYYGSQVVGNLAYGISHPNLNTRAKFLETQFQTIAAELGLYHFGVRLYQLGRYTQATALLENFLQQFPSQEVYNNIGLSHYQQAVAILSGCQEFPALTFQLPTILEETTKGYQLTRELATSCVHQKAGIEHLNQATHHLQRAVEMAPYQIQPKINLSTVLITAGKYTKALGIVEEILTQHSQHPMALHNKAIALYLYGQEEKIDTLSKAQGLLEQIAQQNQEHPASYNLSIIHPTVLEKRRHREDPARSTKKFVEPSPIPIGLLDSGTAKQLHTLPKGHKFAIGSFQGTIYRSPQLKVLVLTDSYYNDYVDLVEHVPQKQWTDKEFQQKYGKPLHIIHNANNETWIYPEFAVDMQKGNTTSLVHFNPNSKFHQKSIVKKRSSASELSQQDYQIELTINKKNGALYKEGEELKVFFKSEKDSYVKVIYLDAGGNHTTLYPLKYMPIAKLKKGVTHDLTKYAKWQLSCETNCGREMIMAFASTTPLNDFKNLQEFRKTETGVEKSEARVYLKTASQ
ncbi:MAG: DUF4384 domain-containing protein [SAR324 cluster bacterium]|nr:DUF4384 domain-containing protein [SAR324 cluster bacterium]